MPTLVDAIQLAVHAHGDQVDDKGGGPYILHPLRVMHAQDTDDARMVAVLHDVVEDTDITLDDLRKRGYSDAVVHAVALLTHDDDTPYQQHVEHLMSDALARAVKIADLEDNMNVRRYKNVDEQTGVRMARYLKAWRTLKAYEHQHQHQHRQP